jgi:hypothetical protein
MLPIFTANALTPPLALVQTSCLLLQDDNEEVSEHAKNLLINTFGGMRSVVEFVKEHKIKDG